MNRKSAAHAATVVASLLPALALAQPVLASLDSTQGRTLAGNCANCHGTTGHSRGAMPNLAGMPAGYFVEQMRAFREGKRPATVMHQLSKGYSDAELAALAEFFARQPAAR
jgi:cytochrome c553